MINQTTLFSSLAYDAVTTFALALNRSITDNELFIQQCGTGEISFNKTKDCKMVSGLIDVTLQGRSVSYGSTQSFCIYVTISLKLGRDQFLLIKITIELLKVCSTCSSDLEEVYTN